MIISETHEWVRVAMAATGALSLFLGYRLFCGAKTARAALITNLFSGALLAVFGIVILFADVRTIHRQPARETHPVWQRKSFETPKTRGDNPLPARFI